MDQLLRYVREALYDHPALADARDEISLALAGSRAVGYHVPDSDYDLLGVCDAETRRFNTEAASLGDGVSVLVVSMDLPFAQQRWCGAAGIENVRTLSDHRDASFGKAYGVLIKELRLLARAVWVVNADGEVRYAELVREITDEPDYDSALEVARELLA